MEYITEKYRIYVVADGEEDGVEGHDAVGAIDEQALGTAVGRGGEFHDDGGAQEGGGGIGLEGAGDVVGAAGAVPAVGALEGRGDVFGAAGEEVAEGGFFGVHGVSLSRGPWSWR